MPPTSLAYRGVGWVFNLNLLYLLIYLFYATSLLAGVGRVLHGRGDL